MATFEEDLAAAVKFHGHLCSGQILGVRMARLAMDKLGIKNPHEYRDLIAYVEADRCIADAVCVITGCKLGRRRLKWKDYGKMAASFVDIASGKAVRVSMPEKSLNPKQGEDIKEFWARFSDEDIFIVKNIRIDIPPEDLPGKPLNTVNCQQCGEKIFDNREVIRDGKILCKACAEGPYYHVLD